jgi:hypothetical protein
VVRGAGEGVVLRSGSIVVEASITDDVAALRCVLAVSML